MVLCGISTPFGVLFPCLGKVAHALLTRPPLKQSAASYQLSPLDLHVLGTPPAFVLSQDQTLSFNPLFPQSGSPDQVSLIRNYCLVCVVCSVSFSRFVPVPLARFSAARATSFVSILRFCPFVNPFFAFFCRFFATFSLSEQHLRFPSPIVRVFADFSPCFLLVYSGGRRRQPPLRTFIRPA